MRVSSPFLFRLSLASASALALLPAIPAGAQSVSQPVVQAVPGGSSMRLNAALGRLARNPRDVDALIEAGMASLAAGDGDAAIGFYQKADTLSPGNLRVKAGLAGAYALSGDPASAIPLFDEAEKLGLFEAARVSDRGLAYDMVGDPVTAQRYYREALMAGPSDETSRRLALSQAISGDRRGMEVTLGPLLQRQDKAAWRTRAFALAILGQADEAESIAKSTMPADLAAAISGYLRYMPKLTQAQQATAANLGQFPRAAEIGRDDPQLARFGRTRAVLASASQSLTPAGQPLGAAKRTDKKDRKRDIKAKGDAIPVKTVTLAAAAPPPVKATQEPVVPLPPPVIAPKPVQVAVAPVPAPAAAPPVTKPDPVVTAPVTAPSTAPPPTPAPVATLPVTEPKPQPGFATLDTPATKFDLKPAAAPSAPAAPAKPRSLAEVFADLTPPSREAEPQVGAVDLRKLKTPVAKTALPDAKAAAARDKACEVPDPKTARSAKGKTAVKPATAVCKDPKDDKAKGPSHPSRYWVQLATGKDKKGLAFDWRKLVKDDPAVFKTRKGYTSAFGQSNRLLTGPFDSSAQAAVFLAQLKKAGVSGAFVWNSPAGQVVDALPGG
ncbi:MAG: tetratricopeptide repeat protein [Novosphingobium sp.]|uniref:SPOR domain-containing protein n=1 Tax=Novosphingobium sp. TaxID=1874826 RepID=UPI0032B78250